MSTSFRSGRAQALVSWAAAVLLLSLILWLSGALPLSAFDDVLSVGAAVSGLVVFVLISSEVRKYEPWASVTLVLGIIGMTLVLAGDALQHVFFHSLAAADPNRGAIWAITSAFRDWLGNGLFFASLILLGGLLVGQGRRWVGVLAIAEVRVCAPIRVIDDLVRHRQILRLQSLVNGSHGIDGDHA